MGFTCPECHKDFGNDKQAFTIHIQECKSRIFTGDDFFKTYSSKRKTRTPNLKTVQEAVEDGRLEAWVNSNGEICFYNHRSKRIYIVDCTQNMDYDPYGADVRIRR